MLALLRSSPEPQWGGSLVYLGLRLPARSLRLIPLGGQNSWQGWNGHRSNVRHPPETASHNLLILHPPHLSRSAYPCHRTSPFLFLRFSHLLYRYFANASTRPSALLPVCRLPARQRLDYFAPLISEARHLSPSPSPFPQTPYLIHLEHARPLLRHHTVFCQHPILGTNLYTPLR